MIGRDILTVRDYFAGQALAGLLANPNTEPSMATMGEHQVRLTQAAFALADAMLRQAEVEPKSDNRFGF
jgi:hypothetical protein